MRRVARRVRPWGSPLDIIASVQDCIVYTRTAVKYRSTGQSVERGSQRTQHNGPPALGHPWPVIPAAAQTSSRPRLVLSSHSHTSPPLSSGCCVHVHASIAAAHPRTRYTAHTTPPVSLPSERADMKARRKYAQRATPLPRRCALYSNVSLLFWQLNWKASINTGVT